MYLLGIDTCGPSGTVALGRLEDCHVEIIAQKELVGRTYSATLISTIEELLAGQEIRLADVGCIVVVNGPGSFTGVRVGLAAAKGLAEGAGLPVLAVSRLEVLAKVAGVPSAALDAHRHEIFLRLSDGGGEVRELLAGASELSGMMPCGEIAVCDDAAVALLQQVWPAARQVRVTGPTAGDALNVAAPDACAGNFADLALLDGHYLRRSDAEIFGHTVGKP
jgi:tRNA threonylcarbamoyladenosine biosynthesis protein TsaB